MIWVNNGYNTSIVIILQYTILSHENALVWLNTHCFIFTSVITICWIIGAPWFTNMRMNTQALIWNCN